ncbi:NLR family CARD domain-containing protein 4 isoform X2 [Alligator sinensis]|uniref:NLR family CARD domain-containing protein 4 n=1 Tax=Alligator sinensis TaxID=38654 RepID=A0A1U7REF1_ALLSI|nr:NLR family CARD domain-containing protein 4 isoform X2 [Alligator sinensis]
MDFIKKNSVHLIQRMGMVTVKQIADDLFASNVLSGEEMNTIVCEKTQQDASRMMIYMVLNKGSEACRILVKALEKQSPFLYQELHGYCITRQVKPDLDGLAQDLMDLYLSPFFQKFHPLGSDIDIIFDLKTTFTDILLLKKDTHNTRKGQLTLSILLGELKNPCIIEGEAGKGKTTLMKRIAILWASGNCPALTHFKFVFFISLSSAKEGLYETVCDQLLTVPYTIPKQDFMRMLLGLRQKVLFLLDGYDEFRPSNCPEIEAMIKENHKFKNMVIVTTRTESIRKVRQFGSLIAETGDLTEENARQLINNVLEYELAKGLLIHLEETNFMKNLMKTPLFVVIACAIQMGESNFNPSTQTALFCTLYDLMVQKNKYKTETIAANHIKLSINHCGDLALDGILDQKFDFQSEDLSSIKEEVLLASGLLNKYTAQRLKPVYRFFHKSFQEYTAGRRLCSLLTSSKDTEMARGFSYLQKMDNISDITSTYYNLLLYTCGSSVDATRIVIKHLTAIYQHGSLFDLPSLSNLSLEGEPEKVENAKQHEVLQATNLNSFVECVINLFYESRSKSCLSGEFEEFFHGKRLCINTQSIPTYLFGFFKHLPNCVSALELIKLDFFGNSSLDNMEDENTRNSQIYIPEKAVSLFFKWNQKIRALEITLQNFNKLKKDDIKYLGKICCSASSLSLQINRSAGIAGTLKKVLETCKNMQDLIVESTPLTTEDEQQIIAMTKLKKINIRDLQSKHLEGGLIDGIHNLINVEKLIFDNIKMNESNAKKLAEGIKLLKKLHLLHLSHLTDIGDGMRCIVRAISAELGDLEEIHLVNCCLSGDAVEILAQNLCNLPKLNVLDLSENYLGKDGKVAVRKLANSLNILPNMKVLMLPWGDDVNVCLSELLMQLKTMPQLTKLGLNRWSLTDVEVKVLGTFFEKTPLEDLQHLDLAMNCVTSNGWLSFVQALVNLNKLRFLDFSSKCDLVPDPLLICKMSQVLTTLNYLKEIRLTGWKLDDHDLGLLSDAKVSCGKEFQLVNF